MTQIGHNNGPTLEGGYTWRKHSWAKARADLLPNLPIEVLRTRVKRAKALGLPYKTYASVRAASGRDVVGFLFSNNALRMMQDGQSMPARRAAQVAAADADKLALVHRPMTPELLQQVLLAQGIKLAASTQTAPHFAQSWSQVAEAVLPPVQQAGLPRDGVLVIGDTAFERDWSEAAKLAGFLNSDRYFATAAT